MYGTPEKYLSSSLLETFSKNMEGEGYECKVEESTCIENKTKVILINDLLFSEQCAEKPELANQIISKTLVSKHFQTN